MASIAFRGRRRMIRRFSSCEGAVVAGAATAAYLVMVHLRRRAERFSAVAGFAHIGGFNVGSGLACRSGAVVATDAVVGYSGVGKRSIGEGLGGMTDIALLRGRDMVGRFA